MQDIKLMKPYPLYKVEYEEIPSRNGKSDVYRIYVKIAAQTEWLLLYVTHKLAWAQISLDKLKTIFDTQIIHFIINGIDDYPMFEIHDQIYKTQYVFPEQSCVCGGQIARNHYYGEYSVDYEKFDYVRDFVFFYKKGTCLVKNNQLFLDGELLANSSELAALCEDIDQPLCQLDSSPDKLIDYLKNKYTDRVTSYECNGYSAFFNRGEII